MKKTMENKIAEVKTTEVGRRHQGDFCDGCSASDATCTTCPWAEPVQVSAEHFNPCEGCESFEVDCPICAWNK